MVQKLLFSLPKDAFDEATEKRYSDFAVMCGRDVACLQEERM